MAGSHISEIYAQELLYKCHGYPLWFPEPESGTPPREVNIGDVGFFFQGKFQSLFNITKAAESATNQNGVPTGFVPLQIPPHLLENRGRALQCKVLSSRSVRFREVEASVRG